MASLRELDLAKVPGVAETIDWIAGAGGAGQAELDAGVVDSTLGSVLKHHEDIELVRDGHLERLVAQAREA